VPAPPEIATVPEKSAALSVNASFAEPNAICVNCAVVPVRLAVTAPVAAEALNFVSVVGTAVM